MTNQTMTNTDRAIVQIIKERDIIEGLVKAYSERLNEFPTQANGLVSEEVRTSDAYRHYLRQYHKHCKDLQQFNQSLTKEQKRTIVKYKREQKNKQRL